MGFARASGSVFPALQASRPGPKGCAEGAPNVPDKEGGFGRGELAPTLHPLPPCGGGRTLAYPGAVLGLLELVLEVADLERSVAFYRDLLGLAEVVRWGDQRPGVWVELGPNEVLGLWPAASGGPGVAIHGSRGGAHVHFACYVEPGSLPEWRRRLDEAGATAEEATFAHGNRSLFVTDPDGNVVELADWRRDWRGEPVAKTAGARP